MTAAPYNAVADARMADNGIMTLGSPVLNAAGANFPAGVEGKFIRVVGAGVGGSSLLSSIVTRVSSTQLVLADAASTAVSSAQLFYGTNNSAAFEAATAAANAGGSIKTVFVPVGKYLCNFQCYSGVRVVGVRGLVGQSVFNGIALAANTTATILLPATDAPVIRWDQAFNSEVADICFVGGDGTANEDRRGSAIQVGDPLDTVNGPVAAGWAIRRCEINGFNRGQTMSRLWDCVVEMCQWNFCNEGAFGGELTAGGAESNTGPADGVAFISCGSNYTDVVFNLLGAKQTAIIGGDFNNLKKWVRSTGSSVQFTGVNLESLSETIFHLVGATASQIDGSFVLPLALTGDLCWNEHPTSNEFSLRSATGGLTYKTASPTGYPSALPVGSIIKRYASAAFETLVRTEYWNTISRKDWSNSNRPVRLFDPFVRRSVSPYGSLGWVATAITGGAASIGADNDKFKIYLDSSAKAVRFAPETAVGFFYSNWRLSWLIQHSIGETTTALRVGLYSLDAVATMIPNNGIGLRLDTVTAGDATAKLEVIVGGAIQTVVDTGVSPATLKAGLHELHLEKRGINCHLILTNTLTGAVAANEVVFTSGGGNSFPATGNYATPAIFLAGSAAQQVYFKQMLFEQLLA